MSLLFKNNISLLVCDMAGTIIKENNIIYKTMATTLAQIGYPASKTEQETWPGLEKRQVLYNHIKKHYGKEVNPICITPIVDKAEKILKTELETTYFKHNNISLIDDSVIDLFDNLRINGIKIALNTGYSKAIQDQIIDHFNLHNKVDDYISSEEVNYGRPFPYMIHRLMERNDVPSIKNVAKIGDTVNDMLEGENAGCALKIGVLTGKDNKENLLKYGDVVINKITDLKNDDLPVFLL